MKYKVCGSGGNDAGAATERGCVLLTAQQHVAAGRAAPAVRQGVGFGQPTLSFQARLIPLVSFSPIPRAPSPTPVLVPPPRCLLCWQLVWRAAGAWCCVPSCCLSPHCCGGRTVCPWTMPLLPSGPSGLTWSWVVPCTSASSALPSSTSLECQVGGWVDWWVGLVWSVGWVGGCMTTGESETCGCGCGCWGGGGHYLSGI